jgi:hypothetical protein
VANILALLPGGVGFLIGGGGAVPSTGIQPGVIEVPFNCQLTAVRLFADQVGTIELDIWNDVYANYQPTVADSIVGAGTKPILSSALTYQDATLTDWDPDLNAGDVLVFNVETSPAPATLTWVTASLRVQRD